MWTRFPCLDDIAQGSQGAIDFNRLFQLLASGLQPRKPSFVGSTASRECRLNVYGWCIISLFLKKIVSNDSQSEQNLSIFILFLWTSQTSQKIPGSICQYLTLLSPTAVTAPRFSSSVLNRQGHTRQGRWIWWVFVLSEQSWKSKMHPRLIYLSKWWRGRWRY